jgi:hypothetical protein
VLRDAIDLEGAIAAHYFTCHRLILRRSRGRGRPSLGLTPIADRDLACASV